MKMKMTQKFLVFLNRILYFLLFLIVLSCEKELLTENENFLENLKEYFQFKHNKKLDNSLKRVFILTDKNCHSCNKFFAKTIEKNINDSSSLLVVCASSSKIDLSTFEGANNVFFDMKNKKSPLFANSKIVFLNQGKIDTIININIENVDSFQKQIENRN